MSTTTKMEFAVEMTCQLCVDKVNQVLGNRDDVKSFSVNLERQQVIIESSCASDQVKDLLESTGKRAVLQGMGSAAGMIPLGAAVGQVHGGEGWENGTGLIQGVIRFVQTTPDCCVVEGTVDGLTPGQHAVRVHENGDLSEGCESCGDVLDLPKENLKSKLYGDLHSFAVLPRGRGQFHFTSTTLQVWELIGRSLVIHEEANSKRAACGIIARSSGLYQNDKKICACDGIVLWDERDHPVAGPLRKQKLEKSSSAQL